MNFQANEPSESASVWLDALRGLAASGVFASHWRDCLFQDYSQLHTQNPVLAVAYFVTGLGHQWVIVFFVLSGYLVGGSVLRQSSRGRWSWREYALNRLTRLYVVLVPALLLGGLIDLAGLHFFGVSDVYSAHHGMRLMTSAPAGSLTLATLLGNYLFLQGIMVPVFGTNGPLWSLSYEFWYYAAFPLLFFAVIGRSSIPTRALSLLGFFAVLIFIGPKISFMGLIWLMGVALHWLPAVHGSGKPMRFTVLVIAATLTVACLAWCKGAKSRLADYVLGVVVGLLLYCILHFAEAAPSGWIRTAIQYSAKSSYTLYLVHLPLLVLITAWIGELRWRPNWRTASYGGFVFIAGLLYSAGVYATFERHTNLFRKWVTTVLGGRQVERKNPGQAEVVRAS